MDISPVSAALPDVSEYSKTSTTFSPILGTGEELVSLEIIDHKPNGGIAVGSDNVSFSGQYIDSFALGAGALKARIKATDELKSYDAWEDLPEVGTAELYEWNAPRDLQASYWYDVELVILYTPPTPPVPPPKPVEKRMTKRYTQTVHGNYDIWAGMLRDYVRGIPIWLQ